MARVDWNVTGERLFQTGIDRGMIYLDDGTVSTWNGLVSITESPSGGDTIETYIDGQKVLNIPGGENYEATVETLSLPFAAAACAGWGILQNGLYASGQPKQPFGFSYRTLIGNDVSGVNFGYKVHVVYNCTADSSDFTHETVKDEPSVNTYSWHLMALPVPFAGRKPAAHVIFDTRRFVDITLFATLESILYGDDSTDPRLPTPVEIATLLSS